MSLIYQLIILHYYTLRECVLCLRASKGTKIATLHQVLQVSQTGCSMIGTFIRVSPLCRAVEMQCMWENHP